MTGRRRKGALLAAGLGLCAVLTAGCSGPRFTVGMMVPILENTADAALRSDDPALVRDALPTSLLLLEGMRETDPGRRDVATLASMLYFAYAFAFVEDEDAERAAALYRRGMAAGWAGLGEPELAAAIADGSFDAVRAALAGLTPDDVDAVLWVTANWASWVQLNLDDTGAVADFARVLPLAERLVELDERLFHSLPRVLLGALHAARPVTLGGNVERAAAEFDEAFARTDRNLLLAHVFYARTYCVRTFDGTLYEETLREVLAAPAGSLPDAELLNRIAKFKAESLLELKEEIFD
jgi:hypothetical protein